MRKASSRERLQGRSLVATLAVCALVSCSLGAAGASAQAANQTSVPRAELGEFSPGMWIFLDPDTGLATDRPSPEQAAAMRGQVAALVNESTDGLVPKFYPDGRKSLDLQGRFMSVSILTLAPGGDPHLTCAESVDAAMAALTSRRPVPTLDGLETE